MATRYRHRPLRGWRGLALAVAVVALLALCTGITVWVRTTSAGWAVGVAPESRPPATAGGPGASAPTGTDAPDGPLSALAGQPEVLDPTKWTQTAGDEFDGSAVNPKKWVVYSGTNDRTGEAWTPSLCTVSDGLLTLRGEPGPAGRLCGLAWLKDQVYGRWLVHARMPFPANPQFALVCLLWPHDDASWPAAGEVDYAEEYDPQRRSLQGFLHYGARDSQLYIGKIPVDTTQWHTYGVEWEPDHVSFLIDNRVVWKTTAPLAIPRGPMHQTLQLNLNREYPEVPVTTEMQVDWVHIYAP